MAYSFLHAKVPGVDHGNFLNQIFKKNSGFVKEKVSIFDFFFDFSRRKKISDFYMPQTTQKCQPIRSSRLAD